MTQERFEARYGQDWDAFEARLQALEKRGGKLAADEDFPAAYRTVCKHLALARDRGYSAHMVDRLNGLVRRGHGLLYVSRGFGFKTFARFFLVDFPRAVRAESFLVVICMLLFYGPFLGAAFSIRINEDLVYAFLDPAQVASMEEMYTPEAQEQRTISHDLAMFGFYIWNNIGIGFRTFAGGLAAGIGSIFLLFFNGLTIGAVFGHMAGQPMAPMFFRFVSGHGAFELNAIVLAGVSGLRLGSALLFPGRMTRAQALRERGRDALTIVYGMGFMLLLAAFVEAFWSPRQLDASIMYGMAGVLWVLTFAYFLFMGRGHEN